MKKIILSSLIVSSLTFASSLTTGTSSLGVEDTSKKFQNIIKQKQLKLFTIIEHSKAAKNIGLTMQDTKVIIFGAPKVGTKLMKCQPNFAIELPLKLLIYKDEKGKTVVAYEDIKNVAKKYDVSKCENVIKKVSNAQAKLFKATTK